jgi:sulfur relay (sulfurtransferase) complex TusBCD TusD component (DsrE family)
MILPQLESERHGADVIGMMFFVDNTYFLTNDDELAKRLQKIHKKTGILLMACDQCAYERNIDKKLISGARIGCFPDLYKAIGNAGGVDQIISF